MKKIYHEKDYLEKHYGDPVKRMSPVNHVITHYGQMVKQGLDVGKCESKPNLLSSRDSEGGGIDDYMRRSQATSIASPRVKKKSKGAPSIAKMLEDLHRPVKKVSMVGLNSHLNFSIDFVATPKGKVNS